MQGAYGNHCGSVNVRITRVHNMVCMHLTSCSNACARSNDYDGSTVRRWRRCTFFGRVYRGFRDRLSMPAICAYARGQRFVSFFFFELNDSVETRATLFAPRAHTRINIITDIYCCYKHRLGRLWDKWCCCTGRSSARGDKEKNYSESVLGPDGGEYRCYRADGEGRKKKSVKLLKK
jgi:hypothetical protein